MSLRDNRHLLVVGGVLVGGTAAAIYWRRALIEALKGDTGITNGPDHEIPANAAITSKARSEGEAPEYSRLGSTADDSGTGSTADSSDIRTRGRHPDGSSPEDFFSDDYLSGAPFDGSSCQVCPDSHESSIEDQISHFSGKCSVYFKTFGCSHNQSDSEAMMGLLRNHGWTFVDDVMDCDLCVINSCTVKDPSQNSFMKLVRTAKSLGKTVIVAGCVPQGDRHLPGLEDVSVVGVSQIGRIVEVAEESLKGNIVRLLAKAELPSLDIPKMRRNELVEIIAISMGCLGACTYCKTRHARGHLGSYAPDAIVGRIETAVSEGVQQIWLTSEDTGAYGLDIGTNIAQLLKACAAKLAEIEAAGGRRVMIRLGMGNPPYMAAHIEEIAEFLNHRNVFRFMHIPVQSGSDKVLKDMVREYSINEFERLVQVLREKVPHVTLATDIICGFPTEKDEDHRETVDLVKRYQFPALHISQFYPRPGTKAKTMKRINSKIVKARSNEVTAAFMSYTTNEFLRNSYQRVWFDEVAESRRQAIGHTCHYVKVVVPLDDELGPRPGAVDWVHIQSTTKWHAEGVVVPSPPAMGPGKLSDDTDEVYV